MTFRTLKLYLRSVLPSASIKRISKMLRKREAGKRKKMKEISIARYGTYDAEELMEVLRNAGIQEGCVLFVQTSFNDMLTFKGSSIDALKALRKLVGSSGTLLMPAFTSNLFSEPPRDFDQDREPTYTGIINEMFRRTPGVIRSLHPRHSICGLGAQAETLLSGHENCQRADGPDSPFDRLRKRTDSYILTLGLSPDYVSFLHWVEDYQPEKLPFRVHKPDPVRCRLVDSRGRQLEVMDWHVADDVAAQLDSALVTRHLTSSAMRFWQLKGTDIGLYPVARLSEELLSLRDKGILHYRRSMLKRCLSALGLAK